MKIQEENPNNSRIFIDYRKNKEKVRFERVGKSSTFKIALDTWVKFSISKGFFILPLLSIFIIPLKYNSYFHDFLRFIIFIDAYIVFYVLGALILSNTPLIKQIPKLNTIGNKLYYIKVNYKDLKKRVFEIPLFSNVQLDYKATGDLGKELYRVEITEHPFKHFSIDKKGKKKFYPQEWLWRARFLFKRIPKGGNLEVLFD